MYGYYVVFCSTNCGQTETDGADVHIDVAEIKSKADRHKLMEALWKSTGQAGMRHGSQLTILNWVRMPGDDKPADSAPMRAD